MATIPRVATEQIRTGHNSVAILPIANGAAPAKFDNEERILDTIRQHLREARRNNAIGKLTFELDINRGGVSRYWVDVLVNYRFLENVPAV